MRTVTAVAAIMAAGLLPSLSADLPPSVPGAPVATQVTETSALLTWGPSTDDTGVTQYEIWYLRDGGNGFYGSTTVPSYRFSWLRPDTSYTWMVRASDGRNVSGFSPPVTFRTDPAPPETQPPTAPGAPVVSDVTATAATVSWAPSTDNASQPDYLVYAAAAGAGAASVVGGGYETTDQVTGLIPDLEYGVHVVARDVSGNMSTRSPVTRMRTAADPDAACRAGYEALPGGSAVLHLTNTGPASLQAWSVRGNFSAPPRLVYATHAYAVDGAAIAFWWSGWSDTFAVGETLDIHLYFNEGGAPASALSGIALNGAPCSPGFTNREPG